VVRTRSALRRNGVSEVGMTPKSFGRVRFRYEEEGTAEATLVQIGDPGSGFILSRET
jgi:hypothetical protein